MRCSYCNSEGHYRSDCLEKRRDDERKRSDDRARKEREANTRKQLENDARRLQLDKETAAEKAKTERSRRAAIKEERDQKREESRLIKENLKAEIEANEVKAKIAKEREKLRQEQERRAESRAEWLHRQTVEFARNAPEVALSRDLLRSFVRVVALRLDVERDAMELGIQVKDFDPAERQQYSQFRGSLDRAENELRESLDPETRSALNTWLSLLRDRDLLMSIWKEWKSDAPDEYDDLEPGQTQEALATAMRELQRYTTKPSITIPGRFQYLAAESDACSSDGMSIEYCEENAAEAMQYLNNSEDLPELPATSRKPDPPVPPTSPTEHCPRHPTKNEFFVGVVVLAGLCLGTLVTSVRFAALGVHTWLATFLCAVLLGVGVVALTVVARHARRLEESDGSQYQTELLKFQYNEALFEAQYDEYLRNLKIHTENQRIYDETTRSRDELNQKQKAAVYAILRYHDSLDSARESSQAKVAVLANAVTAATPLLEFESDPQRGGNLARLRRWRPDIIDTIEEIVRGLKTKGREFP